MQFTTDFWLKNLLIKILVPLVFYEMPGSEYCCLQAGNFLTKVILTSELYLKLKLHQVWRIVQ